MLLKQALREWTPTYDHRMPQTIKFEETLKLLLETVVEEYVATEDKMKAATHLPSFDEDGMIELKGG
jgi:hypothetical protein